MKGLGQLLQFNDSKVRSQQHGDGLLQELAELNEPLSADCPVHHPVITAQCHRHHTGYVKSAKPKKHAASVPTQAKDLSIVDAFNLFVITLTLSHYQQATGVSLSLQRRGYRPEEG